MSMAYPLLFRVLTNLDMMDFAENIDLYPTGPSYAAKLQGSTYTCCDKDGARKLAINMGISEEDANGFAEQIGELLEHYKSLSSDYLDFLESRAD